MAIPVLLGLLASQGARSLAMRIAGSAATRRKIANVLARNYEKSKITHFAKGKFPTDKTLTSGLTKNQKGLLSNLTPKTTSQVPGQPINLLRKTPTASTYGQRIGTGGERTVIPRRGVEYTQRFKDAGKTLPVHVPKRLPSIIQQPTAITRTGNYPIIPYTNPAAVARGQALKNKPMYQSPKDSGLFGSFGGTGGAARTQGLVPGLITAGSLGYGASQIPGMMNNEVAQSAAPRQQPTAEADPRFMQVINPGYESTGKEVLNAALLRAGLRLAGGGNLRETIDAAASVADSRNIFRTGQEALAAGKRNLGDAAKVYVQQNKDGTWTYTGSIDADPMAKMKAIFGDDKKIITKDILETAKRANPGKTDEEVIAGLIASGFTQGAETVT